MKVTGNEIVRTRSIAAPVGGLNARDALANMKPTDAVIMENFFPSTSEVVLRNGYTNHATDLPAWVETLMAYNGATGNELFAISDGEIYDVTTSGAVDPPVVSSLTNSRWQYINFSTAGGQYLYAVNGADDALLYDGTNWTAINSGSSPAITGVDTDTLINVAVFKNRIWFIQEETFKAWYLPINSIGGAAESIDFGPLFKMGGYLVTMASFSIDNAGGIDDFAAFISSEGEIAVYRGYDPSSASTWALVGLFYTGRPVGRRCVMRMGSDVILICSDGFMPLSKLLLTNRAQLQNAISNKILNLVNEDVKNYRNNFGWQPILFTTGNKLIINVPQTENSVQYQYVMNIITGSWCKFTGWNAACWEVMNDQLFFGGNAVVCQADTGFSDNDDLIVGDVQPAFSYFGVSRVKRFTMIRPVFRGDGTINAAVILNVDFGNKVPTQTPSFSGSRGSPWDTSPWNTTPWGGASQIQANWQGVTGIGTSASVRMRVSNNAFAVAWQSIDYVFEVGGIL